MGHFSDVYQRRLDKLWSKFSVFGGGHIELPTSYIPPTDPKMGDTYFCEEDSVVKVYDGDEWKAIAWIP